MTHYKLLIDNNNLPVSTDEVNEHLKLSIVDIEDDINLSLMIRAVLSFSEKFTNQDIMKKTYVAYIDNWLTEIELARCPFVSISSIKYYDVNDVLQTVGSSNYYVPYNPFYSSIFFNNTYDFPSLSSKKQPIEITFVAGMALADANVPKDIKLAILNHIAFIYENRGDCLGDSEGNDILYKFLPPTSRMILSKYKILEV